MTINKMRFLTEKHYNAIYIKHLEFFFNIFFRDGAIIIITRSNFYVFNDVSQNLFYEPNQLLLLIDIRNQNLLWVFFYVKICIFCCYKTFVFFYFSFQVLLIVHRFTIKFFLYSISYFIPNFLHFQHLIIFIKKGMYLLSLKLFTYSLIFGTKIHMGLRILSFLQAVNYLNFPPVFFNFFPR